VTLEVLIGSVQKLFPRRRLLVYIGIIAWELSFDRNELCNISFFSSGIAMIALKWRTLIGYGSLRAYNIQPSLSSGPILLIMNPPRSRRSVSHDKTYHYKNTCRSRYRAVRPAAGLRDIPIHRSRCKVVINWFAAQRISFLFSVKTLNESQLAPCRPAIVICER
jgi:hypothetical protein